MVKGLDIETWNTDLLKQASPLIKFLNGLKQLCDISSTFESEKCFTTVLKPKLRIRLKALFFEVYLKLVGKLLIVETFHKTWKKGKILRVENEIAWFHSSSTDALSAGLIMQQTHKLCLITSAFSASLTVPGYISRSVAGSYDNEGIAIFALLFTYYLWVSIE